MRRASALFVMPLMLLFAQGCGSSLAQPFDQMKQAPITVYRLQNFEPPPQQQAQAQVQLPPQIQQWIQQGAQMLPPGLIPPGLIPGAAAPAPTAQDAMRFHGFRVLGWKAIPDKKNHDEVLDIFGKESSFTAQNGGCMFAEFGFSIAQNGPQPADILVSLSCDQAQGFNFNWPYTKNGLTSDTAKRIVAVVNNTFGG